MYLAVVGAHVGPLHDGESVEETCYFLIRLQSAQVIAVGTAHTGIEYSAVVFGCCKNLLRASAELLVHREDICLGQLGCVNLVVLDVCCIVVRICHRHIECREEFLDKVLSGEDTLPWVCLIVVRHTALARTVDEHRGCAVIAGLQSVLTDREDYLLHSLWVLVVVGHEELLVT